MSEEDIIVPATNHRLCFELKADEWLWIKRMSYRRDVSSRYIVREAIRTYRALLESTDGTGLVEIAIKQANGKYRKITVVI